MNTHNGSKGVSLNTIANTVDLQTQRNMNLLKYVARNKGLGFVGAGLLTLLVFSKVNIEENFVKTRLSEDEIRYNREFQRMKFLEETTQKGHLEDLNTKIWRSENGVGNSDVKIRKDLTKKNPHYKYF